uniref:BTB (POZ) domain containing 3a n=1 Tax=Neogobius melanostomus TaxID=47308 RepID=A0A8C6WN56_9GOBI
VMFNNEMMADVHFVVGPPGGTQRYVLAVGSSVFHAMFYGELAEDQEEIRIPDVEPPSFLAMLKWFDKCLSSAQVLISVSLSSSVWEVIDAQAELSLRSEGFCDIDMATLERDGGVRGGAELAEAECGRQELSPTIENKRQVLGKAIYMIRSGVLTLTETNDIFLWTFSPVRSVSAAMPPLPVCAYRSNQWRYRGRCDSIQFAVDKRVFIAGFGLYGSSCGSAEYSARIELKRQGATVAQRLIKYFSDGSSSTFPVFFDNPVQIEPDTFYTASVVLDGNELSYFGQEGMTEVQSGKVTFQFQCSGGETTDRGAGGQIPELIFYA